MKYPVIFFVFKRPATTLLFLRKMEKAGIKKIYVYADGPRNNTEKVLTDQVKKTLRKFEQTHSQIKLILRFNDNNVGLKTNIVYGLNQVFKSEKAAIVLEDDCMPSLDFFRFCSEMLDRYAQDKRVMSVSGTSVGFASPYSYDFSKYQLCWGWATWKRAWQLYDPDLNNLANNWQINAPHIWKSALLRWYWQSMLKLVKLRRIDTWDYQWSWTILMSRGLAIIPSFNLIENIGFDSAATNTKFKTRVASRKSAKLSFPLVHPGKINENILLSTKVEKMFYSNLVAILGLIRQQFYYTLKRKI